jgi:hypothetical protein
MELTDNQPIMQVIYSIEISPFGYTNQEYQLPDKSSRENPEAWTEYWYKCIVDSGIENLKPIKTGSFLVDIDSINDKNLSIIVKKEIEELFKNLNEEELNNIEEYISCFAGGIAIIEDNNLLIEPNCCSDLRGLSGWKNIFSNEEENWSQLWIGHPWIFYKKTTEFVAFSDYTELNLNDFHNIKTVNKFHLQWLRNEINKANASQAKLKQRVLKILIEMNIDNPINIAKILTGSD